MNFLMDDLTRQKTALRWLLLCLTVAVLLSVTGCAEIPEWMWGGEWTPSEWVDTALPPEGRETDTAEPCADTAEEPEPDPVTLTLRMVGDMLLHPPVVASGKRADGTYSFDRLFTEVRDEIAGADIAIVNEEVLLGGAALGLSGYPRFNGPFEVADAIAGAGFDVVLHATNHAMDKGEAGLRACLDNWRTKHPDLSVVGMYDTKEAADTLCVLEKNGIRVAVLNYTYGLNGLPLPADMPYAVRLLDENTVRADLSKAKDAADLIVVCPHWGTEYTHVPSATQKKWCDLFLECGADVVIGTHPHVIQPVEWVTNGDGETALVYWSLGNFVNATGESGTGKCARMLGGMADLTVEKLPDGSMVFREAHAVGLVTQILPGEDGITTYPFYAYTEEMAEANVGVLQRDATFSYDYCRETFEQCFGSFLR